MSSSTAQHTRSSRRKPLPTASPTAVAFDSSSNLWVANAGNNSITEYGSTGVQNSGNTITAGVSNPQAMAFDGIDDLWVNNGFETMTIYPVLSHTPYSTLPGAPTVGQYTQPFTAIASSGGFIVFGNNKTSDILTLFPLLVGFPGGGSPSSRNLLCCDL